MRTFLCMLSLFVWPTVIRSATPHLSLSLHGRAAPDEPSRI